MKINFQRSDLALTVGLPSQFPKDGLPQIAFSGRSNVGKSSLINTLMGRKSLARVSSSPGKTITVNFYLVDSAFYLVDLPGYGFAKRSAEDQKRWSSLTDGFFTKRQDDVLKCVVQLIDCKVGPTKDDLAMLEYMNASLLEYVVVLSKSDKPNKTERDKTLEEIKNCPAVRRDVPVILFSSQTGDGKDALRDLILSKL